MNEEVMLTPAQQALQAEWERSGDTGAAVVAYYAELDRAAAAQSVATETSSEPSPAAAAREALAADRERAELAEGARLLVAGDPERYGVSVEMAAELDTSELLRVTGIEPKPDPDPLADDEDANAKAAHAGSVERLSRTWWTLTDAERRAEADALALDFESLTEQKQRQLERF
jgi:hypothetical protein